MPTITSRQHALVKAFRDAARGDGPLALLDGWHLLREASAAGLALDTVALVADSPDEDARQLLLQLERQGTRVFSVTAAVMRALSPVRTPSGVVALAERRRPDPARLLSTKPALILVADGLQDPGNVGALIRAAEAGGATGTAFVGTSADPWGWKALRAGMGSTFRLPVVRGEHVEMIGVLRSAGVKLLATVPHGGTPMYDVELREPTALVFGGEGQGLEQTLLAGIEERISVPMQPPVESLNVAVAAALLVYEARRQRTGHHRR